MKSTCLAAALLIALGSGATALAGETPPVAPSQSEADDFTLNRAYFEPGQEPGSSELRGLIRSLERARELRPVSSGSVTRPYSLESALWEQSWRLRVSEQLETLLK